MEWPWGSPKDPHLTAGEASTMMDVHDKVYLEHLVWVVYDPRPPARGCPHAVWFMGLVKCYGQDIQVHL